MSESVPATLLVRSERMVAGGDALARTSDGRVLFVTGALPDELVLVELTEVRKDFARGRAVEVHEASPDRVTPPCPHRIAGCGGCDWQHLTAPGQMAAKVAAVTDALRRTARLADPEVVVGRSVSATGYRTTMRAVGGDDGRLGFRHERSHDVVVASGCLIAHERLREMLAAVSVTPGLEVTLRVSTSTPQRVALWDPRLGDVEGLAGDVATGADAVIQQQVAGADLRVSAMSFFQSGPQAAELLVDAVRRAAPELDHADWVVDLYGGVGLFAATVVPPSAKVTVVESSRPAVADARVNVPRAQVVSVEVGRWRPPADGRRPPDVVIADPPRTGLGKPGVAALARAGAATVALVSCDPAAAARDTALLTAAGYRHRGTEVLDLFPHTHHVETVTRFTRSPEI